MRGQRVVITGMGAVSPYGEGVARLIEGLDSGRNALSPLPEHGVEGVGCRVAGLTPPVREKRIPRELRRAMSPMSVYACLAAWEALEQAGFAPGEALAGAGVSIGSTLGSPRTLHEFFADFLRENSVESVRSTVFFKVMGHSAASNVALACGCGGRVLAPAAACASGLVGLGLGYEAIASGREQYMLCGGADEFHLLTAATFDRLGAASHATDPARASLPFDAARQGIVCGEGAGVLLLESLDSALARGASILAEVRGFSMINSANIAQPDAESIARAMREALQDALLKPEDIAFVNAHATATEQGDVAEGQAIAGIFGARTPVNSLKGHLGHTMAACGALESIACVESLRLGRIWPTLGLSQPDPLCGELNHVTNISTLPEQNRALLKNCFALGGCTCSMVFETYSSSHYYSFQ